jgi:hypothetical protein
VPEQDALHVVGYALCVLSLAIIAATAWNGGSVWPKDGLVKAIIGAWVLAFLVGVTLIAR